MSRFNAMAVKRGSPIARQAVTTDCNCTWVISGVTRL
jgi:hypothetical protein